MSAEVTNKSLLVGFLVLLLAGLADGGLKKEQASILSQVQVIEEPELAELIEVAILRSTNLEDKEERPKIVRRVTELYAQIKLLDNQIEQISRKISFSQTSEAARVELILAKAELEATRLTELAELREVMNIVPKHPFMRRPESDVADRLSIDVMGELVCVYKGFQDRTYRPPTKIKILPANEVAPFLDEFFKNKSDLELPLRIDISRTKSGQKLSEELYEQVIEMVKAANLQLDAEVHLEKTVRVSEQVVGLVMAADKLYFCYADGQEIPLTREDVRPFIADVLKRPGSMPLRIELEFDKKNSDLASNISDFARQTTKELGIEKLVEIKTPPREPDSLIGKPLPKLDNVKTEFDIKQAEGKPILICFLDVNQQPSQHCIEQLAKQAEQFEQKGITIVAIQASKADQKVLDEWVKKHDVPFPVGMIEDDVEKTKFTWGVRAQPWLILTDKEHIVRAEVGLNELDQKIKEASDAER